MKIIVPVFTAHVGCTALASVGITGATGTLLIVVVPTEKLSQLVSLSLLTLRV